MIVCKGYMNFSYLFLKFTPECNVNSHYRVEILLSSMIDLVGFFVYKHVGLHSFSDYKEIQFK